MATSFEEVDGLPTRATTFSRSLKCRVSMRTGRGKLVRQVTSLLDGLGSSAHEVGATLARQGIRGIPGDENRCALAAYLWAVVGCDARVRSVTVRDGWVMVGTRWRMLPVAQPSAVRSFIRQFDAGCFPELNRSGPLGWRQADC